MFHGHKHKDYGGILPMTPIVSTSSKTRPIPTCHHCGELGHIRPKC